jgi:membrane protein implicated in regulation of membrane protease activity
MNLIPWVWAIIALFFVVTEIFTTGFYLLCFGIGAAAASALAFLGFDLTAQLAAFAAVSALAIVISRPLANRVSSQEPNSVGVDRVLGQEAVVVEPIAPLAARGQVRVGREVWSADSIDERSIAAGARVVVVAVDGARLKVRLLV